MSETRSPARTMARTGRRWSAGRAGLDALRRHDQPRRIDRPSRRTGRAGDAPSVRQRRRLYAGLWAGSGPRPADAASLMTLAGGWLFGPLTGSLATVLAATAGAIVLFWLARSLLHDFFLARTGEALGKLRRGFQSDAASYLLTAAARAGLPFVIVNLIAAALLGARCPPPMPGRRFSASCPAPWPITLAGAGLKAAFSGAKPGALAECLCGWRRGVCTADLRCLGAGFREIVLALGAPCRRRKPCLDLDVASAAAGRRRDAKGSASR
jgi:hypothetical protein